MEGSRDRFRPNEEQAPVSDEREAVDVDATGADQDTEGGEPSEEEAARKERFDRFNAELKAAYERTKKEAEEWVEAEGYEPQDMRERVAGLLKLTPEEQSLPVRERRRIKADRLAQFHRDMESRRAVAAALVTDLRAAVLQNPDVSREELRERAFAAARENRFTARELQFCLVGIENYLRLHAAVEKARAEYPDDADLAEACFGIRPEGEVQVEKGAFTLHFRVFEEDDFARLHGNVRDANDEAAMEQARAEMRNVGGYAPHHAEFPEIAGGLAVERMQQEPLFRGPAKEKSMKLYGKGVMALWNEFEGPADIAVEGAGTWRVRRELAPGAVLERTWTLERLDEAGPVTVKQLNELCGSFGKPGKASVREAAVPLVAADGTAVGTYTFSEDALSVSFKGERAAVITLRREPDEGEYDKRTRIHEEQHQFDNLMQFYNKADDEEILRGVALSAARGDDPVPGMLRSLARQERSRRADLYARTEFLAFYRDGRSPAEALNILSDPNGNYKYEDHIRGKLPRVATNVAKEFARLAEGVLPGRTVAPEDALPQVQEVFRDEYLKQLKKWAEAMQTVEDKLGAAKDREKVIGILTTASVNEWPRLARMLRPSESAK